MSNREIEHTALLWHEIYAHRMAINTRRLALAKEIRARPGGDSYWNPAYREHEHIKSQITLLKAKERKALKTLAKACAKQRDRLGRADVIDVEMKQLASVSTNQTTPERNRA